MAPVPGPLCSSTRSGVVPIRPRAGHWPRRPCGRSRDVTPSPWRPRTWARLLVGRGDRGDSQRLLQFDAETLTPSYRLLKGVPGRSYGLAIARRLGVAADVLADAERSVPDAERQLDRLLAGVEAKRQEVETHARELVDRERALVEERDGVERRGEDVAERERAVRDRERSLDTAAREQARAYLLDARKTVEAALAQARAAVDEATAREARRLVEEALEKTGDGSRQPGAVPSDARGWQSLEELKLARGAAPRSPLPAPRSRDVTRCAATEISLIWDARRRSRKPRLAPGLRRTPSAATSRTSSASSMARGPARSARWCTRSWGTTGGCGGSDLAPSSPGRRRGPRWRSSRREPHPR